MGQYQITKGSFRYNIYFDRINQAQEIIRKLNKVWRRWKFYLNSREELEVGKSPNNQRVYIIQSIKRKVKYAWS